MSGLEFVSYAMAILGIALLVLGFAHLRTADRPHYTAPADGAAGAARRDELTSGEVIRQGAWSLILAGVSFVLTAWVIGRSYFRQVAEL